MPTVKDIALVISGSETLTFKPKSVTPGASLFEERTGGIAIGYDQLGIFTEDLPNVRRVKIHARINHISAATGADAQGFTPGPRLDRFDEVDVIFKSNRRSGKIDRDRLTAIVVKALANADVLAVLSDEEEIL